LAREVSKLRADARPDDIGPIPFPWTGFDRIQPADRAARVLRPGTRLTSRCRFVQRRQRALRAAAATRCARRHEGRLFAAASSRQAAV